MDIEDTDSVIFLVEDTTIRRDIYGLSKFGGVNDLMYEKITPLQGKGNFPMEGSLFERFRKGILHTLQYQTFPIIIKFLREAALDPKVRISRITVYRLADILSSSILDQCP